MPRIRGALAGGQSNAACITLEQQYNNPECPQTWYNARMHCENEGGFLACPRDRTEADAVQTALNLARDDGERNGWIGVNDEDRGANWFGCYWGERAGHVAEDASGFNYGTMMHHESTMTWLTYPNLFRWRNSLMASNAGATDADICSEANGFPANGCTGNAVREVDVSFHLWESDKPPDDTGSNRNCARSRQTNTGNTVETPSYYWDPIDCTTVQPYICMGVPPSPPAAPPPFEFASCYAQSIVLNGANKYLADTTTGHPITLGRASGADVFVRFSTEEIAATACRWWPRATDETMAEQSTSSGSFVFFMDSENHATSVGSQFQNPYITRIGTGWLGVDPGLPASSMIGDNIQVIQGDGSAPADLSRGYIFRPQLKGSLQLEVLFKSGGNRHTSVQHNVYHANALATALTLTTVTIDQSDTVSYTDGTWANLGTFNMDPAIDSRLEISCQGVPAFVFCIVDTVRVTTAVQPVAANLNTMTPRLQACTGLQFYSSQYWLMNEHAGSPVTSTSWNPGAAGDGTDAFARPLDDIASCGTAPPPAQPSPPPPLLPPAAPPSPPSPPLPPPSPPPQAPPPFNYMHCFGVAAGSYERTDWVNTGTLQIGTAYMRFENQNDAAETCRWWPNVNADTLTRVYDGVTQGGTVTKTPAQVLADPDSAFPCIAVLMYSAVGYPVYWLRFDNTITRRLGEQPARRELQTSTTSDGSVIRWHEEITPFVHQVMHMAPGCNQVSSSFHCPLLNFDNCGGSSPPPPSPPMPAVPPYPPPPPNNPMSTASCPLLAPWFTYRADIRDNPRRRRDQCRGIVEWYCARDDTTGKSPGFSAVHVYDFFCKNSAGSIVFCLAQDDDGNGNCEGEAVCDAFTPACNGNSNTLDCTDSSVGQTEARFVSATAATGYSYIDSAGHSNCLHKFGLLYEWMIRDAFSSYARLNTLDESDKTSIRPCYVDSDISPFRNAYENTVSFWDVESIAAAGLSTDPYELGYGAQACAYSPDGGPTAPYTDQYRGNRNHEFWWYVPAPGLFTSSASCHTGMDRSNWGFGTNFMSTLPYWNTILHSNTALGNSQYYHHPSCAAMSPGWSTRAAAAAGLEVFLSPEPPSPPPEPPAVPRPSPPPPKPPLPSRPPPSPPSIPPASAATGPTFSFASPPPPAPPITFMRRHLSTRDGERTTAYVWDSMHLRKNMTVAQRWREAERFWGRVPTMRELAARVGVSRLVKGDT